MILQYHEIYIFRLCLNSNSNNNNSSHSWGGPRGHEDVLLFNAGIWGLCRGRSCPGLPALVLLPCWGDHMLSVGAGKGIQPHHRGSALLGVPRCEMVKALEADKRDPLAAVLPHPSAVSWKWIWCPLDFNSRRKGHFITSYDKLQRDMESSIRRNSKWNQGGNAPDVWKTEWRWLQTIGVSRNLDAIGGRRRGASSAAAGVARSAAAPAPAQPRTPRYRCHLVLGKQGPDSSRSPFFGIKSELSECLEVFCPPLCAAQDRLCVTEARGTSCNRVPHPSSPSLSFSGAGGHLLPVCRDVLSPAPCQEERTGKRLPAGPRSPPGSRLFSLGPVTYLEGCQGLYGVCQALSASVFSGILIDKLRRC